MGEKEPAPHKPQYGKLRTRTANAREFARQLRRRSTAAEKRLWRLLRDRRFNEFKFRRQYACGIYFLDFYCTVAKLAVELDGGGHGFPDQRARDEKRNEFLALQGLKVLRFWNHQMGGELEAIRFEIWHALMERTGRVKEIEGYLPKPPHSSLVRERLAGTNAPVSRPRSPSSKPSPPMGEKESAFQPIAPQKRANNTINETSPNAAPPPPPGERVRVRGQLTGTNASVSKPRSPSSLPSPPMGEKEPAFQAIAHLTKI